MSASTSQGSNSCQGTNKPQSTIAMSSTSQEIPSRGAMGGPGLHAYDFLVGLPLPAAKAHALPAHALAGPGAPGE